MVPDDLGRIGRVDLAGNSLAMQGRNGDGGKEEASQGDGFGDVTAAAVSNVNDQSVNSLLLGLQQSLAHLLRAARGDCRQAQDQSFRIRLLAEDLLRREFLADDVGLLRFRSAAADDGNL